MSRRRTRGAGAPATVGVLMAAMLAGGGGPGASVAVGAAPVKDACDKWCRARIVSRSFLVMARDLPLGFAEVAVFPAGAHFNLAKIATFEWVGADGLSKATMRSMSLCTPEGAIERLDYESETHAGGRIVWSRKVTVGYGKMAFEGTGLTKTLGRDLAPLTYGLGCLLGRKDAPGAVVHLEPALLEEEALLGNADLVVTDAGSGSRRLSVHFESETGVVWDEQAVVRADGSLEDARSATTLVRYVSTEKAGPSVEPVVLTRHSIAPPVPPAAATPRGARWRVGAGETSVALAPPLPPHAARLVEGAIAAARLRWDLVGATCRDYSETAREWLSARGFEVALVTGWVAFERRWVLHRWVRLRIGERWHDFDPTLGSAYAGLLHVPLIQHGSGAGESLRVESALVATGRVPPVLVAWEP